MRAAAEFGAFGLPWCMSVAAAGPALERMFVYTSAHTHRRVRYGTRVFALLFNGFCKLMYANEKHEERFTYSKTSSRERTQVLRKTACGTYSELEGFSCSLVESHAAVECWIAKNFISRKCLGTDPHTRKTAGQLDVLWVQSFHHAGAANTSDLAKILVCMASGIVSARREVSGHSHFLRKKLA